MNFELTCEQKEYVQSLRSFLNEINDSNLSFPQKWKAYANFGLFGIPYEEDYGGWEEDYITVAALMIELGYSCNNAGFLFIITNHLWATLNSIYCLGSSEQKRTYLGPMIAGDKIGALALTDAESGSDISKTRVTAIKVDGGYIINGSKTFISNGPIADVIIVTARTGPPKALNSITCFICEKNLKGLNVGPAIQKMGLNDCPMSEIIFDNVYVSDNSVLGRPGNGIKYVNEIMQWERCFEFSVQIGIMKRLMEKCVRYSIHRGLSEFQSITSKIAKMKVDIEMAELYLYKIAEMKNSNINTFIESSIFKYFVSETYVRLCIDVLQIFGAYGYSVESGIEAEVRDALAAKIYAGTNEIQLNIIYKLIENSIKIQDKVD